MGDFTGQRIAIDASMAIYQFLASACDDIVGRRDPRGCGVAAWPRLTRATCFV